MAWETEVRSQVNLFVTASHQIGLDTRSIIWGSIIMGFRGGEGRAQAEARTLLDCDAARPPEGGSAETGEPYGLNSAYVGLCPYQVESHQRLKNCYLMLSCLTLSIIRYGSWVKWSNPGKGVVPFSRRRCCSNWKGSLQVALDNSRQLQPLVNFNKSGSTSFIF